MGSGLRVATATIAGVVLLVAGGCRVDAHRDGTNDDVKIKTPFGGMSVKTNESAVENGLGLTVYPGATIVKKDKDNGAADVNMSFGSFHLGVKAVSYRTPDSPDKVLAFYRKDMAKFGTVILCRGYHAVGQPDHTQDGLSCDKDHGGHINVDDESSQDELKAGSKLHQHVVAVDGEGSGTKFGLIALDLPGHIGEGESDKE